jgi:hypothetical protein
MPGCRRALWTTTQIQHGTMAPLNRGFERPVTGPRPLTAAVGFRSGSLFPFERLLLACGTHQYELHQHEWVTEPTSLPVADDRQKSMRFYRLDVACAVRILGL